jgi:exopolysaccharide biosynthesis polyprenyl glycosylphosphotransferase
VIKRLLDVLVSALVMIGLAPVMLLCALAVRLDSPGPVFFRQTRAGKDGKPFSVVKFRSMRTNADSKVHEEYVRAFIAAQAAGQVTASGTINKLVSDPRVTRTGRWLRKTSLDELPQLWNVLRGDMSIVGPRPPIPYELEHYSPDHMGRLAVKPGITGLWQVSGRSRTTFEEMVSLDLRYITARSILLDLRIILLTIPVVLLARDGC